MPPMRVVVYRYCLLLSSDSPPSPDPFSQWISQWNVDRFYQDLETLEPKTLHPIQRPQLEQLFQDCRDRAADFLLIDRWDDLADSLEELQQVIATCQALRLKIHVRSTPNPDFATHLTTHLVPHLTADCTTDLEHATLEYTPLENISLEHTPLEHAIKRETASDKDSEPTLTTLNALQKQFRSRSIQQGHARNRLQALPPPGRVPYGYQRSPQCYVIDPSAAPIVKAFFDQFLLFGSVRGAVRYLKQNYHKTLSPSTALRWLTSPVYRGHLEYASGDVIRNTHPPILLSEEAAQVDRLLQRNRRVPKRAASSSRSLSGLVICKACQSSMTVTSVTSRKKSTANYLYLRPTHCQAKSLGLKKNCSAIDYSEILQRVIDKICHDLPKAIAPFPIEKLQQISQQLEQQISNKLKNIVQVEELESTGILDSETAQLRSYKLRTEIAALQSQQSRLPPTNLVSIAETLSIPAFWADLSESERRFYLREFLQRVEWIPGQLTNSNNQSPIASPSTTIQLTNPQVTEVSAGDRDWSIELVFTF